jgi:hypothetical protein
VVLKDNYYSITHDDLSEERCWLAFFTAKDGKDILVQELDFDNWMCCRMTNCWQYNPTKDSLEYLPAYFDTTMPFIKTFFNKKFSFKGIDTATGYIRFEPYNNKLECRFIKVYDVHLKKNDRWRYPAAPYYKWVGTWNGASFIWERRKEEE